MIAIRARISTGLERGGSGADRRGGEDEFQESENERKAGSARSASSAAATARMVGSLCHGPAICKPIGSLSGVKPHGHPSANRRFYGSVVIDMARPVKAFNAILDAVVMELQRTPGAKVKLTLEIEGEAPDGFADEEVSIVEDNARQLKFRTEATGFAD